MKRVLRGVLRRLGNLIRRSPWLTEQVRRVLIRVPGMRARLLRINAPPPPGKLEPVRIDIAAISAADRSDLPPEAVRAYAMIVAQLSRGNA